jgi:hypothetical protein
MPNQENSNPSRDPKSCDHERIDIVGGTGDQNHTYDTLRCIYCGWEFDLCVDGFEDK